MKQAPRSVTGIILAGGQGRRLGGVDKGLTALHGRPMVSWVAERLAPQVAEIMIIANRHLDEYRTYGHDVLQDLRGGFLGPLAGVETALSAARHGWVLTCPVDAPLLPHDYASRMIDAAGGRPAVAVVGGHAQPVYSLIPKQALPALRAFLTSGGRKMGLWLQSIDAVRVDFDHAAAFADADTHQQLAELARALPASPGTQDDNTRDVVRDA
jgi:molybdenum cofactor guanylyltransferase